MPYYSPERRAALLKMLLPPLNLSMAEVSRREGVSEMSLSNWRKRSAASICGFSVLLVFLAFAV
ncbi:hypothetical protein B7R56_24540, partial [Pseudomonas savastanoi pv. retacarpa]|uniref:hypothetical protein n=1 Tax=Pseudomonas savastanoi TaxID=29438 RepID=UPI000A21AA53